RAPSPPSPAAAAPPGLRPAPAAPDSRPRPPAPALAASGSRVAPPAADGWPPAAPPVPASRALGRAARPVARTPHRASPGLAPRPIATADPGRAASGREGCATPPPPATPPRRRDEPAGRTAPLPTIPG